jgi:predicted PurR-regulated permease PerM
MSSTDPSGLTPEELWHRYTRYPYVLARVATVAVALAVVVWTLQAVQGVLVPVLASLLIAYLLDPAVDEMQARGINRTRAIGWLLMLAVIAVLSFAVFLVPAIRMVLERFLLGLPQLLEDLQTVWLPQVFGWFGQEAPVELGSLGDKLQAQISQFLPDLAGQVASGVGTAWSHVSTFTSSLINLVLVPLFTFYFLRDFDELVASAAELIPPRSRAWVAERAVRADAVVGAWFRGQLQVAAILGALYAVGLGACFGLSHIGWGTGVALGVLSGALNFIPYVGTGIGIALTFSLLVLDGVGWGVLLGAAATFVIVQTIEGYIVTPRIVGEKVGLSPLAVILVLAFGAELFGLAGMLLALPLAGIAKAFWPDLLAVYHEGDWYNGRVRAPRPSDLAGPTRDEG